MEDHKPKISLPEAIIILMFLGLADAVELAILFLGLDDFWISDAIAFPITQLYLRIKGVRGTYCLITNLCELIPYVGSLPLKTTGFLITLWYDCHPKTAGITMTVGQKIAVRKPMIQQTTPTAVPAASATPTQTITKL